MTATEVEYAPTRAPAPFRPFHKWDRNFFAVMVAAIWIGIVMGFGGDMIDHVRSHKPPYPLIVHFHAAVFVAWLALLTTQLLLIRNGRQELHRKLGILGVGLAVVMVVIGPMTALVVQQTQFGTPDSNPPFLAVPLGAILAFAGLAGAAFLLRKDSSGHKRLILLATLFIANAGFARWLRGYVFAAIGHTMLSFYLSIFLATDILMLAMVGYDLYTRHKLHPAFVAGLGWTAACQALSTGLFFSPWWRALTTSWVSH